MSDHDQRFKALLREFFAEFFRLFFAAWAERIDFTRIEWLDKEVFSEPPQGKRRFLDLVAKVATRQIVPSQRPGQKESCIALIHVEIEHADSAAPLRPRMFHYYQQLREQHGLPVLPICVYLRVGLNGVGSDIYEEYFWDLRVVHFEYLYVGLPALDAVQYVQGESWLGAALSALMRISKERQAWLGAEALRRIKDAPVTDQQRFLLAECVQAYLPLGESQQEEFERLLTSKPYEGVQAMRATWSEQAEARGEAKGRELERQKILQEQQALRATWSEQAEARGEAKGAAKGEAKGRELERKQILHEQLEERFGPLSPAVRERLQSLPSERLSQLVRAVVKAQSLQELGLGE